MRTQAHAPLSFDRQAAAITSASARATAAADALETDIHVLTLRDFLAEQPLDWCLPAALCKQSSLTSSSASSASSSASSCDAQTACPESPCSVACVVSPQLAPAAFSITLGFDIKAMDGVDADELLPMWMVQPGEYADSDDGGDCEYDACNRDDAPVKSEYPAHCPYQRQHQFRPRPSDHEFDPQPRSLYRSSDVGKERLRKRQRAYEQKYRKKKRINFKQMRREWLSLETLLYSLQAQRAQGIADAPLQISTQASLQTQLMQLYQEEKALERDHVLMYTAWRWKALFVIQTQEETPKFPATMREWELLADTALGLSYSKPFVPPHFTFSW